MKIEWEDIQRMLQAYVSGSVNRYSKRNREPMLHKDKH